MFLKNFLIDSEQITDISLARTIIETQEVRIETQEVRINQLETHSIKQERLLTNHIIKLEERISYLEKNSSNSSKPPSSDIVKPQHEQRQKGKRKIGGQSRHKGSHRLPYSPEDVDKIVEPELSQCPMCGGEVCLADNKNPWVIQQAELVSKPVEITEYRLSYYYCAKCKKYHRVDLPAGVREQDICGARLQACIAHLKGVSGISHRELQTHLKEVFDFKISIGGISNIIKRVSAALLPAYEELGAAVRREHLLHVDETGWKDKGLRHWAWVCCNKHIAYFHIANSRSTDVLHGILGEKFSGALISDFYSVYVKFANVKQQFCLAHLIRDIKFLTTLSSDIVKSFGDKLLEYFANIFKLWHRKNELPIDQLRAKLKRQTTRLCNFLSRDGEREGHVYKMKKRLFKHWKSLFRFAQHPEMYEPTNNCAEQTLRIVTKIRYLTQGTRSRWGQAWWSRILSVIGTCKKLKTSSFQCILALINANIDGDNSPTILANYNL